MKTTKQAASVLGTAPVQADLMAMFQQFLAMQGIPANVSPVVGAEVKGASVKSKASKKAGITLGKAHPLDAVLAPLTKPAKVAKQAETKAQPVQIVKLANSFFVIGEQAPAKLAEFFTRKPHLDRGFKERDITGMGKVKAYWFGARQLSKIERILAK